MSDLSKISENSEPGPRDVPIILFDGVCGLCNRFVNFVLAHDAAERFRFASLQSRFGQDILNRYHKPITNLSTIYVLFENGQSQEQLLEKGIACRFIFHELGGIWKALDCSSRFIPLFILNWSYDVVAHYRYRFFGRYSQCSLPEPRYQKRFIET